METYIEWMTKTANELFDHQLIEAETQRRLLEVADYIRLLERRVSQSEQDRRKEREFLGSAVETMALRLAALRTEMESRLTEERMKAHMAFDQRHEAATKPQEGQTTE